MFEKFFGPGKPDAVRLREGHEMLNDDDSGRKKGDYVPIEQVEDSNAEDAIYEAAERGLRGHSENDEEVDNIDPASQEPEDEGNPFESWSGDTVATEELTLAIPGEDKESKPIKYPDTEGMRTSSVNGHDITVNKSNNSKKGNPESVGWYENRKDAMRTREERKSEQSSEQTI